MKLTVIIPVYNEKATILELYDRVKSVEIVDEIIIIDDGSTDGTSELLAGLDDKMTRIISHDRNLGKGASIRSGFKNSSGDVIIIQDADLEYDPIQYAKLISPIIDGMADVVYGSRFISGDYRRVFYFWHYLGNKFLTLLSNMLTNLNLSDMETCYKVFRRDVLQRVSIEENRFGFEPEITAKIAKLNIKIFEIGISYSGRTYGEGKKIGWKDGVEAIKCIIKYNLLSK